ncbi:MAG: hypothetical protein WA974_14950 [Thermodesulfobacteriota bacterium]
MMKTKKLICGLVVPLIALVSSMVFGQPKGGLLPCDLFTKAEAEALFKVAVSEGQTEKTSMPAGMSCQYSFRKKGATYGVTLKVSTLEAIKQEGIYDSPKDYFSRQKRARLASDMTAKKLKMIPGLGDDAFWNGFALSIIKGHYCINIVVNSFLRGSFQNSGALEKARYDQDLALAQKVAEKVLPRIK